MDPAMICRAVQLIQSFHKTFLFYRFIALVCSEKVAEISHSMAEMISTMEMPKKMPMVPPNWETRQSSWQTKYSSLGWQRQHYCLDLACRVVINVLIHGIRLEHKTFDGIITN